MKNMTKLFKRIGIFALLAAIIAGNTGVMKNTEVKAANYVDTTDYESLKEIFKDYFKVGVAVQGKTFAWGGNNSNSEIGIAEKENLIKAQFNSMTFGNELKPAYNFSPSSETLFSINKAAKDLLDWCKENNMPLRGHTLVWHSQVDTSFFAKDFHATVNGVRTTADNAVLDEDCLADRETVLSRLKTYIYGAMEYMYANGYADVIYAWDVVNEASDEGNSDCLRRSYWYKTIGDDFLYYCFLYAREAENLYAKQYAADYGLDPEGDLSSIKAQLFYNDYNEWFGGRSNGIVDFLCNRVYNEGHKKVQSDAIKPDGDGTIFGDGLIDGIGMQGHLDDKQNIETYRTALRLYSDAVGNVHITELDVGKSSSGEAGEFNQAKFYNDFFTMLVEEVNAGCKLTSVTLWGLTDDTSWRSESEPLIFNRDLSKKPAFIGMANAGKGEGFDIADANKMKEAKNVFIDFEAQTDGAGKAVPADYKALGFRSRGTGHQANFMLTREANHTPDINMGFCLKAFRKEADATVSFEASQYIGHTIKVTSYVKSKDSTLRTGIDFGESVVLCEKPSAEKDFVELVFYYTLPEDLRGADIFFETDGTADIFIDDVQVELWDDKEIPAEAPADETAPSEAPAEEASSSEASSDSTASESSKTDAADTGSEASEASGSSGNTLVTVIITAAVAAIIVVFFVLRRKNRK